MQSILDDGVQVGGFGLRGGELREHRELIHQCAQGFDRPEDDIAAGADNGWRFRTVAVEVTLDTLCRESNGRERVLDLMRDALRDFLPGKLTLRLQKLGHILKNVNGAATILAKMQHGHGGGKI